MQAPLGCIAPHAEQVGAFDPMKLFSFLLIGGSFLSGRMAYCVRQTIFRPESDLPWLVSFCPEFKVKMPCAFFDPPLHFVAVI